MNSVFLWQPAASYTWGSDLIDDTVTHRYTRCYIYPLPTSTLHFHVSIFPSREVSWRSGQKVSHSANVLRLQAWLESCYKRHCVLLTCQKCGSFLFDCSRLPGLGFKPRVCLEWHTTTTLELFLQQTLCLPNIVFAFSVYMD